jgi:hypothetical protein
MKERVDGGDPARAPLKPAYDSESAMSGRSDL